MRFNHSFSGAWLAMALAFGVSASVHALPAQNSPADVAAVRGYTLTDGFIDQWKLVQKDTAKDPCNLGMMKILNQDSDEAPASLDQMVASYDAQPGVHAMLASHGLAARDFVLGVMTLFSAGLQDTAQAHPDMVKKGYIKSDLAVSDANMAVYHRHKADIHQTMQQLGQQALRENGGKLPACAG